MKKRNIKYKSDTSTSIIILGGILVILFLILTTAMLVSSGQDVGLTLGKSTKIDQSQWQIFSSSEYGYSIKAPAGWVINDSYFKTNQEIMLIDPKKLAAVKINAYYDSTVKTESGIKKSIKAYKNKIEKDPKLKVKTFNSSYKNKIGGFISTGTQVMNNAVYVYQNRGLIATNGKVLIFLGLARQDVASQYNATLSAIIDSFFLK